MINRLEVMRLFGGCYCLLLMLLLLPLLPLLPSVATAAVAAPAAAMGVSRTEIFLCFRELPISIYYLPHTSWVT